MTETVLRSAVVIGCGLIGTSVALALTGAGVDVALIDEDPAAVAGAERLGAGAAWTAHCPPADLVVVATPPAAVVDVLYEAQARGLGHAYTDVAGTKEIICAEAELRGCDLLGYVPGHPMAGAEQSGPAAARADLFAGRPWILCPYETTPEHALAAVTALVELCGARRADLAPHLHDDAVAVLSHAPHLVATALAAEAAESGVGFLDLAGDGLRDTVRIAGGDPWLWSDILTHNALPVADAVEAIARQLALAASILREGDPSAPLEIALLLEQGRQGRAALDAAREQRTSGDARAGDRV